VAGGLSPETQRFIERCIHSVEQLEVLLLLRREPTRVWNGDAVARELRIDPASATTRLDDLARQGLAAAAADHQQGFSFSASTPELSRAVDAIARDYAERRVSVISAIFSRPTDALQSFADAFRIRGKR
jgi:hypothetical protein